MAPNTRNFLVGSAIVAIVGLCTGLVAYYGGARPGGLAARADFSYVPADVSAVAYADVRQIMDSAFRQRLREVMPTGAEKDRLLEETGINIERDIDSVLAGLTGTDARGTLVLLTGRFDRARIETLAMQHGARQEQYGGRALLVGLSTTDPSFAGAPDGQTSSIAFLDDNLLALGDVSTIRRAIDVAAGGQALASNADMMRFITAADDNGNAWLVGRGGSLADRPELPAQMRGQFEGLEWVSVSANIDQEVRGLIRAEARDDQSGEQLRSVLAGAISAAKMFGEQDARLAGALSSVQASGSGRSVELSFEVSPALLELFKGNAPGAALPTPAP